MSACSVKWCSAEATRGGACAIHDRHPVLNSYESFESWCARLRQQKAATVRAAMKRQRAAEKAQQPTNPWA